jgi:hypothetical protein
VELFFYEVFHFNGFAFIAKPLNNTDLRRADAEPFGKKCKQALLALPSTGGEVNRVFKESLYTPVTSFLDDRGWIIAEKRIPWLQGLICISRTAVRCLGFKFIQMLGRG